MDTRVFAVLYLIAAFLIFQIALAAAWLSRTPLALRARWPLTILFALLIIGVVLVLSQIAE